MSNEESAGVRWWRDRYDKGIALFRDDPPTVALNSLDEIIDRLNALEAEVAALTTRNDQLVADGQQWLTIGRENDELREQVKALREERDRWSIYNENRTDLTAVIAHLRTRAEAAEHERDEALMRVANIQEDAETELKEVYTRAEAAEAEVAATKEALKLEMGWREELVTAKEGQRLWNKARMSAPRERGEWAAAVAHQKARAEAAERELAVLRERKDGAYEERNRVVAFIARIFPSGIARTAIEGWDEEWHGCVYINSPMGQLSWHFHDSQAYLFKDLPPYEGQWDGHSTDEKYARLTQYNVLAATAAAPAGYDLPSIQLVDTAEQAGEEGS